MATALAIVSLFNEIAPGIAELIVLIRRKDGTIQVMPMLDEADAKYTENLQQAAEWFKNHPMRTP